MNTFDAVIKASAKDVCELITEKKGNGVPSMLGYLYNSIGIKDLSQILSVTNSWAEEEFKEFFAFMNYEVCPSKSVYMFDSELKAFAEGVSLRYKHKFVRSSVLPTDECLSDIHF